MSVEKRPQSDLLDFSPIFFPDLEEYKKTLPRRKKQTFKDACCGISSISWFFLLLALLQGILVTGIQIAIAILGSGRLDSYVGCLEQSLEQLFNKSFDIPANSTLPSFGKDKQIYVFFFISLVIYNFFLVVYALKFQNIVEVYSFMVTNKLIMIYGCIQVYQFRGFGPACDPITLVGYLALTNVLLLLIFNIVFLFLSLSIYVEFGWKTYVLVDCDPDMRYYYRVYQFFMSVLKLVLLFLVIFSVGQCVLILNPSNYEFPLTILLAIVAILALPIIYLIVTSESKLGAVAILLLGVLLVLYFCFKIYRYASRSCPLCKEQIKDNERRRMDIIKEINSTDVDSDLLHRSESFEHLIMIAGVNILFTIIAVMIFVQYLRQYNKGLTKHFAQQPINRLVCKLVSRFKRNPHKTDEQKTT